MNQKGSGCGQEVRELGPVDESRRGGTWCLKLGYEKHYWGQQRTDRSWEGPRFTAQGLPVHIPTIGQLRLGGVWHKDPVGGGVLSLSIN